jgi:hypothetical protein
LHIRGTSWTFKEVAVVLRIANNKSSIIALICFNLAARTSHELAIVVGVTTDECSVIGTSPNIISAFRTGEEVTIVQRVTNDKAPIPAFQNVKRTNATRTL